jgi:diguanylate cyclase
MADDSSDSWKKKYTVARDRLEQQERYLAEVEALLRHTIARLSIVAESGDPRLARELDKLRKAARTDHAPAELRILVENVANAAKRLEHAGTAAASASAAPALKRMMLDLVGRIDVPEAARGALVELSKAVEKSDSEADLNALAVDLAAVLSRAGTREVRVPAKTAAQPTAQVLLTELLTCLPVPPDFAARAETLRESVDQRVAEGGWMSVLTATVDLVGDMRRRLESEKTELENFLLQLQERLKDLDQSLEVAETARRAAVDSSQQLDRRVDAEVSGIESSVHQAASLDQIKQTIQQRVEVIRTHMNEHRQAEASRQAELEHKLKHATSRLQAVEKETTHLRAHLRKRKLQAMADPLTGIPNRIAFEERIDREYGRWKRYASPLALLVMDVDHFKQINDTYGHRAGDKALKLIAQVLKQSVRETDLVARYGGEEFTAIVPETTPDGVVALAEKLRQAVENAQFHYHGIAVPITISIGIAGFRAADTPETAFVRADKALYQAKSGGRNRVHFGDA